MVTRQTLVALINKSFRLCFHVFVICMSICVCVCVCVCVCMCVCDFMPINVTFVCQFLAMDSEND